MSKRVKVFGIGLNKTGTTTLGSCLKQMGYKHLSHSEELSKLYSQGRVDELLRVAKQYDSFEDWPWPLIYKDLAAAFPEAKFILTLRKSDAVWLKSFTQHSYKLPPDENYHELIFGYKYPLGHKKYHLDFYNRHNQEVIEFFKNQPDRLLVVCWERGDGWTELASYLGLKDFPQQLPHVGAMKDWHVPLSRYIHNAVMALRGVFSSNKTTT